MTRLAEKIAFLSNPASYGGQTAHVTARETHMSWVFLTDRRVYKLKKPVRYPFLDFGTLAKRRYYCDEELRLNRRLAQETYLSLVPLRRDRAGALTLFGSGRIVEWLVEMKRLPLSRMLDNLVDRRRVNEDEIARIGKLLADFYAGCRPEPVDGRLYLEHFLNEHAVNRSVLRRADLGLSELASPVLMLLDRTIGQVRTEIEERISRGCVVEGHGDLRPEHVCLVEPLQIIDCLEFNRSMRLIDPFDEVNYLGMECEMLSAAWIRPLLLDTLEARLRHRPSAAVMGFYGAFRALLRARLCLAHLLEKPVRHPERWHPLAARYIEMARKEATVLRYEMA